MVMDYDNFAVAVVVDWALSGMPTIGVFAVTEFDMVNVCEFWFDAVHRASSLFSSLYLGAESGEIGIIGVGCFFIQSEFLFCASIVSFWHSRLVPESHIKLGKVHGDALLEIRVPLL